MDRLETFKHLLAKEIAMIAAHEYESGMMCRGHDYDVERVCKKVADQYASFLEIVEEIYDASGDYSRLHETALAVPGEPGNVQS